MNIIEAAKAMKEGVKIKWNDDSYIFMDHEGQIQSSNGSMIVGISIEGLLADDWEIVEPPDVEEKQN